LGPIASVTGIRVPRHRHVCWFRFSVVVVTTGFGHRLLKYLMFFISIKKITYLRPRCLLGLFFVVINVYKKIVVNKKIKKLTYDVVTSTSLGPFFVFLSAVCYPRSGSGRKRYVGARDADASRAPICHSGCWKWWWTRVDNVDVVVAAPRPWCYRGPVLICMMVVVVWAHTQTAAQSII
jgi:hypothetical protein